MAATGSTCEVGLCAAVAVSGNQGGLDWSLKSDSCAEGYLFKGSREDWPY